MSSVVSDAQTRLRSGLQNKEQYLLWRTSLATATEDKSRLPLKQPCTNYLNFSTKLPEMILISYKFNVYFFCDDVFIDLHASCTHHLNTYTTQVFTCVLDYSVTLVRRIPVFPQASWIKMLQIWQHWSWKLLRHTATTNCSVL